MGIQQTIIMKTAIIILAVILLAGCEPAEYCDYSEICTDIGVGDLPCCKTIGLVKSQDTTVFNMTKMCATLCPATPCPIEPTSPANMRMIETG